MIAQRDGHAHARRQRRNMQQQDARTGRQRRAEAPQKRHCAPYLNQTRRPTPACAACSVRGGFLQSLLLDRLQTPHARAGHAQARRLDRTPANALSDHDPEGTQPSPSAQPTQRRGTARWRESREGKEMTHATTAPRSENAMEDTMSANDTQGACAAEGAMDLRNAPRAGHSLRCSAEPPAPGPREGSRHGERSPDGHTTNRARIRAWSAGAEPLRSGAYAQPGDAVVRVGTGRSRHERRLANALRAHRSVLPSPRRAPHDHPGPSAGPRATRPAYSGRTQIWTNTVNVGTATSGSNTVYGYNDATPAVGSLSNSTDRAFGTNILSRSYTLEGLLVRVDAVGVKSLTLHLTDDLTTAEKAKLALHICGETFLLSSAQHNEVADSYTWTNVTLDWSSEISRTIYLSVQGGTACNAPSPSGRTQIWTNTMNVGTATSGSNTVYGYNDAAPAVGSLSDSTDRAFGANILSRSYTLEGLLVRVDAMGVKSLTLHLTDDLTTAEKAKLALHICGETFLLSTAQHNEVADSYTWANVTLDWSSEISRTIYLSVQGGTACNAPSYSGRTQIWTNTVNVGTATSGSNTVYGYNDATPAVGSLSDSTNRAFGTNILSRSYTLEGLLVRVDAIGVKSLTLHLTDDLTTAEKTRLALHICGEIFLLSTAQHNEVADSYTWTNVTLEWSSEFTRTIYLSVQANKDATGKPSITGTALVEVTLTAGQGGPSPMPMACPPSPPSPISGSMSTGRTRPTSPARPRGPTRWSLPMPASK